MKYIVPQIYDILPKNFSSAVCLDGNDASFLGCEFGTEASSGCGSGIAAGNRCLSGAAAGGQCTTGTGFE